MDRMRHIPPTYSAPWTALTLSLALLSACERSPVAPGPQEAARAGGVEMTVQASISVVEVAGVSVEVSGRGIPVPPVVNLTSTNGLASGSVQVPAGGQRTFTMRAFDADGVETHRGSSTVPVREGQNATISVTMEALEGSVPIEGRIGTYTLALDPVDASLDAGETLQFSVTVTDVTDAPVVDPELSWGSLNPVVASVDGTGLVTAHVAGQTVVTAYHRGFAVAATVVVAGVAPKAISTGFAHTCVLARNGKTFCWGSNRLGQLGDGTLSDRNTPTAVQTTERFVAIAGGANHTCALTAGGRAYCWGYNGLGQLGTSATVETCSTEGTSAPCSTTPAAVQSTEHFVALSAEGSHTCALTAAGKAYCWGSNVYGQLGDGTSGSHRSAPVAVLTTETFVAIDAGASHTCGITPTGDAHCWGQNAAGQLGDGTRIQSLVPVPVEGSESFVALTAGLAHTCGIRGDGAAFCWGRNAEGELGIGTPSGIETSPVPVSGGHAFSRISAGARFTCAATREGKALCWGSNTAGKLGDGTLEERREPTAVATAISSFALVAAGGNHACALTTAGGVYCWGGNLLGELGNGSVGGTSTTPVEVLPVWLNPSALLRGDAAVEFASLDPSASGETPWHRFPRRARGVLAPSSLGGGS